MIKEFVDWLKDKKKMSMDNYYLLNGKEKDRLVMEFAREI